jgi:hypothetical protein
MIALFRYQVRKLPVASGRIAYCLRRSTEEAAVCEKALLKDLQGCATDAMVVVSRHFLNNDLRLWNAAEIYQHLVRS